MWLLEAPEDKFGKIPWGKSLLTPETKFFNNICFTEKFVHAKNHIISGCVDITPRFLKKSRTKKEIQNFLFIVKGGIGDILWIFPFIKKIKSDFPKSNIAIMTDDRGLKVFQNFPYLTCIVKEEGWLVRAMCDNADEIYDFSGMATFYKGMDHLDPVERPFTIAGFPAFKEKKDMRPHIVLTALEGRAAIEMLSSKGISAYKDTIISIALEASTPNRSWPMYNNLRLAKMLSADGHKIILLSEKKEHKHISLIDCNCGYLDTAVIPENISNLSIKCPMCQNGATLTQTTGVSGIYNLSGETDVRSYMAILALSNLFIGPNSSGIVIATALNTPTIGLFGAFNPKNRTKFYEKYISIQGDCQDKKCEEHWTECKYGHPAPCMRNISAEKVYDAAIGMIDKYKVPAEYKLPAE